MFILDTVLIGGLRFVFDKIAAAVDTELNDDTHLREELLAAQMRLDLGEMNQAEFDTFETYFGEAFQNVVKHAQK